MRRITTMLLAAAFLGAATPGFAQDSDAPGFGSLVGGLVGGAIGAAIDGRHPRAGDLVPGAGGGGKNKAGGGQHGHAPGEAVAQRSPAHAGGGGQAAPVRRKPGK